MIDPTKVKVAYLKSLCIPQIEKLNNVVLDDPLFLEAPGGREHHHNFRGGLLVHTFEVMRNVMKMTYGSPSSALVTAVIWHDYMKVREYSFDKEGKVIDAPYRKMIGHVAGSAMKFHYAASQLGMPESFIDCVEHLLLSHHGRKEWGSPVEPATGEAFILHAADMMSSRGVNL